MSDRKRRKSRERRNYGRGKGARALQDFLDLHGVDDKRASEALGVTRPAVISWTTGRSVPGGVNRKKIDRWTDGVVPESIWGSEAEIDAVKPFSESNGDAA